MLDQLNANLGNTFAIERELGGGGMSRVFLAEETALRRKVVVKVLPADLSDSAGCTKRVPTRRRRSHTIALQRHYFP